MLANAYTATSHSQQTVHAYRVRNNRSSQSSELSSNASYFTEEMMQAKNAKRCERLVSFFP